MTEKVIDKEQERWTKTIPLFVPHHGLDAVPEVSYVDGKKEVRYMLKGSVNGKAFSIECDKQIEVSLAVADALAPMLKRQKSNFLDNS